MHPVQPSPSIPECILCNPPRRSLNATRAIPSTLQEDPPVQERQRVFAIGRRWGTTPALCRRGPVRGGVPRCPRVPARASAASTHHHSSSSSALRPLAPVALRASSLTCSLRSMLLAPVALRASCLHLCGGEGTRARPLSRPTTAPSPPRRRRLAMGRAAPREGERERERESVGGEAGDERRGDPCPARGRGDRPLMQ